MIRDPSDGSVREKTSEFGTTEEIIVSKTEARKIVGDTLRQASGLPFPSTKPENLARLEKSREWLRDYRKGLVQVTSRDAEIPIDHPDTEREEK